MELITSRWGHVDNLLPVRIVAFVYSYRRRRRRGRVVCPHERTVAFTVCLTLTIRTSPRAISATLTISSMNRLAVNTACSNSTTSTGTSSTTSTRVMRCASSTSGKPPGNPKTTAPPYQADCLLWITRRYPSSFHQSEAVTWRMGGPIVPMLVKTITKVALATTNQLLSTPNLLPTPTITPVTKCLTHRTSCRRNPSPLQTWTVPSRRRKRPLPQVRRTRNRKKRLVTTSVTLWFSLSVRNSYLVRHILGFKIHETLHTDHLKIS